MLTDIFKLQKCSKMFELVALTQRIQHSQSDRSEADVTYCSASLTLRIRDDRIGFDLEIGAAPAPDTGDYRGCGSTRLPSMARLDFANSLGTVLRTERRPGQEPI